MIIPSLSDGTVLASRMDSEKRTDETIEFLGVLAGRPVATRFEHLELTVGYPVVCPLRPREWEEWVLTAVDQQRRCFDFVQSVEIARP